VTLSDGDRLGVVGINGTGKSTLLRLLAGVDAPETGVVRRARGSRVGYLGQRPELPPGTVRSAVGEGWEASAALERLGMGTLANSDVATLSGGQAKRVALAAVLVGRVELLILDEPTNHLDLSAIAWLEGRLAAHAGGLVLVTHDRHLLDRVTTRMLELDRGRAYVHEGGYSSYLEARAERDELAAAGEAVRRNLARRELAWLRRGAPARTAKPQARIAAAEALVAARPEGPARRSELELGLGTPRLGDKVVELDRASVGYGSGLVLRDVSLALDPRERLGVVGPNGAGKSTLLELIASRIVPEVGTVEHGPTVVVGVYDQLGVTLDPEARVREIVAGPTRAPGAPEDVSLMERFWFGGDLPWARVGTLSGGERRRLQLLVVLAGRPNVLLLDEPTNDLDLDTLRVLEDYLDDWPGALVAVSHDRAFLERATERIVVVGGAGRVEAVPGGLAAWMATSEAPIVGSRRVKPGGRTPPGPPKGRSASTLGRAMRDAERAVARLEGERNRLETLMNGTAGHAELGRIGIELAAVQESLVEAEEAWLSLAEEAEAAG
jgi:ATP-binding cassette subfamily F protein uup